MAAAPSGFRRVAPAFALFFLSPFVAECLLGDFSINAILPYLFVAPAYGGGALLIRELARRTHRGWPTMLAWALAYGLLEEGILIQTLFNPNYLGLHLLASGWVPALGIGMWWTPFVLTLHMVWSISTPIALMEGLYPDRRESPWLGTLGLSVTFVLFVLGSLVMHVFTVKMDKFHASAPQLLTVWVLIVAFAALGLRFGRELSKRSGAVPAPLIVGIASYLLGIAFMRDNRLMPGWPLAGLQWVLLFGGAALLLLWGRRESWTPRHILAAAGGALLTYATTAFGQPPVVGGKGPIALLSHLVFGAIAIWLFTVALKKQPAEISAIPN